jgi:hypothetical protein
VHANHGGHGPPYKNFSKHQKAELVSDAPTAQAVNVPGVQVAEILPALGAVIHVRLQAKVALTLPLHPVIVGVPRFFAVMAILQMSQDLRLAHFPVSIPSRPQTALNAGRAVPPHDPFLSLASVQQPAVSYQQKPGLIKSGR